MKCEHLNFACQCDVNRLLPKEGEPPNRFQLDVRVTCSDCGLPFRFIGLPAGMDLNGAAVSVDATEGRFAIAPKGEVLSVIEGALREQERRRADALQATHTRHESALRYVLQFLDEYDPDRQLHPSLREQVVLALGPTAKGTHPHPVAQAGG